MAQCPFYVTFSALSATQSRVSWWRQEAAVVRQQYFNSSTDLWMVRHEGDLTWANPLKPPSGYEQSRRSSFLSICADLTVFTEAGTRLNHHLPRCGVFIGVSLHTVVCQDINTDAHGNTNPHCLCVSLSGQIRKHDIIFLLCLCTSAHPLTLM